MADDAIQPKSAVKPSTGAKAPGIIGDIEKIINKRPHLRIKSREHSLKLTFEFPASIPHVLRIKALPLFNALFDVKGHQTWVDNLLEVHSRSVAKGSKPAKVGLRMGFRKLFLDALSHLVSQSKAAGKICEPSIKRQVAAIEHLRRKRIPVRNRRHGHKKDALDFAKRHKELLSQVKKLRQFIDCSKKLGEPKLRQAIKNHPMLGKWGWISYLTHGAALQNLPMKGGDNTTTISDLKGSWAPWQLSVGIIYCEERNRFPDMQPRPLTIYKYILHGNKLLKMNS